MVTEKATGRASGVHAETSSSSPYTAAFFAAVPRIGERVIFRGELGDVPAEVRWAFHNEAGGIFLKPGEE